MVVFLFCFFLLKLSRFSLCFCLSTFSLWHVWMWISLPLTYLEFNKLLGCVFLNSSSKIFKPLFLQKNFFSAAFSLFPWHSHYVYADVLNGISHFSKVLFIFFNPFSLCSLDYIISTDLSSSLLIVSSRANLLLSPLVKISVIVTCQFQNFHLVFKVFHLVLLSDILNLMRRCHHTFHYLFASWQLC